MNKEKISQIAESAYQRAYHYEGTVKGCAQSVLFALEETIGGIGKDVMKAGTGFAGGCARTGNLCGAFSGGVMAISCYVGRTYEDRTNDAKTVASYRVIDKLTKKFMENYSGCNCPQVQKKLIGRSFNLHDEEERKLFAEAGAYVDKCTSACGNSAKWVVEILAEEGLLNL